MLIGHTLKGRYRIYDELGSGGAATVYLGRDSETGQMVVVKLVHSHLVDDQFIGRFEREVELLRKIDNPNIVALYDWALHEYDQDLDVTLNYIIAEFIEGHTLADIIDNQGKLSEQEALDIGRQLARALLSIHDRGIIHRDVKAQNIMITPDGMAKLIDFGIAKGSDQMTLTAPSHFAGTLHYAAPEQILEARDVDQRADIYSLGVVFYEMLMGHLPVRAKQFGTIATKIIAGDLEPLSGVSYEIEELVDEMLDHRVDRRIASTQAIIDRIDAILGPQNDAAASPATEMMTTVTLEKVKRQEQPTAALITSDGVRITLTAVETVIGRGHPKDPNKPDVDLYKLGVEEARTASRRHLRISEEDGHYYVKDLDSMNGTYINGERLESGRTYRVDSGDLVEAGRVQMTFQRDT